MKNLSLIALLLLMFFSCREDIDIMDEGVVTEPPIIISEYDPATEMVSGTVFGRVFDENEIAVANATVNYEGRTVTTDTDGRFILENEALDSQGTFFTVEAEGFFKGSRRIYPRDGSINYATVQLLALDEIGSFEAATGGEIVGDDGLRIRFTENSIRSNEGDLYNGEVTVAAKWLDPTAPNIADIMPGDLLGLNARVEEVSLVTYGMMAVELFDERGNNVNIAEGNTATLSFPVPEELLAQAPAEIPLWSFEDEQFGIWAEEGFATLEGDRYIGEVSHFSYWNCDVPFPLVNIEGQLVTEDGVPLANATVCICVDGIDRCGTTDNNGFLAGKVPADKELILKFGHQGQECAFNSVNLGSLSNDTNLGTLEVPETDVAFAISGSIVDCGNIPITKGLVKFSIGNTRSEIYVGGDGSFEVALLNCDNADVITVTAVNIDNLEEGFTQTLLIEPNLDFGVLSACGNTLTEFFTLNVNGQSATIVENLGVFFDDENNLQFPNMFIESNIGTAEIAPIKCVFQMQSGAVGAYNLEDNSYLEIQINDDIFTEERGLFCVGECSQVSSYELNITENGGEGGHWAGDFNGFAEFANADSTMLFNYPFSGDFRVPITE